MSTAAPVAPIPVDFLRAKADRQAKIRESWVGVMEARLVREELQKCWRTEGVNHYEVCHPLVQKYLTALRENRIEGFIKLDFTS